MNKSLPECERIIANLKAGYPRLTQWQAEAVARVSHYKYSETWLGRRRYLPRMFSAQKSERQYAQRCALNTPIQGTAADILKLALGRMLPGLTSRPWLRPLLQIHDELVFEVPCEHAGEAAAFIRGCMEAQPFPDFDVPILAEAAYGPSFGELEDIYG